MKLYFTFFLALATCASYAQQAEKHPWAVEMVLPLSETSGIAGLAFREKQGGVAFVDENGVVTKEISLAGRVVGLSKWKENVIAFYVDTWDKWKKVQEIHAVLIDPRKKALVSDQLAYSNPGKNTIAYTMTSDDQGNFGGLVVRVTNVSGNYDNNLPKDVKRMGESSAITMISFADPFRPISKPLISAAIGSDYLSSYANRKGEVAIISYANGQVVAEKFGPDGQPEKKLTAPLPDYTPKADDWNDGLRGLFNPGAPDILCVSLANPDDKGSHRNLATFVFDFGAGKVITVESAKLGSAYLSQLKIDGGLLSTKHFKSPEDFRPDGIMYAGDTLIVSKEIRYNEFAGQNVRFVSAGTVVSLYDKDFHLIHNYFLDRYVESFSNGAGGWTYHLRDGQLLALGTVITGGEHYDHLCYSMDLKTYHVEGKVLDWGNGPHSSYPNVATIFWFRDNLLKNLIGGTSGGHYDSWFVRVPY